MPKVAHVERRILRIEGFEARFLHEDGRDLRGDKEGLPQYPFRHAASHTLTVDAWKRQRIRMHFPGYRIKVVDARGEPVAGNTRLATLRADYEAKGR